MRRVFIAALAIIIVCIMVKTGRDLWIMLKIGRGPMIYPAAIESAARKYVPGVTWQPESIVTADFTCRGRAEHAILGLDPTDIVVAVFINGLSSAPEVIRDPARSRDLAKIQVESLDYDPKPILGEDLRGFQRSKTCKGLNLYDESVDSLHLFWNRVAKRFEGWSL